MEYFIVVGGILSLPIIKYCTSPITIDPQDTKDAEDKASAKTVHLSEEKIKEIRENAQARKDRILSRLNPSEQELFKEYINEVINPSPKSTAEKCFMIILILLLILILMTIVMYIINSGPSQNKSDL